MGMAIVILRSMSPTRTLPLFDPHARPQSWNERMVPGEYATLYSSLQVGSDPNRPIEDGPFCTVFSSLAEAEEDARRQVALLPTLACRIYDHHGLGRQPIREICGKEYKGRTAYLDGFGEVGVTVCLPGAWCSPLWTGAPTSVCCGRQCSAPV